MTMDYFVGLLLAFARISSFLFMVPFLKGSTIPSTAKVAISLALAFFAAGDMTGVQVDTTLGFVTLVFLQIMMGVALAFFVEMFFQIAVMAGSLMDFDMGLAMAEVVDPTSGRRITVMSNIFKILFTVIFIAVGGLQLLIANIMYSFKFTEPNFFLLDANFIDLLLSVFAYMMVATIQIALPFMATIFIVNFIFLIIGRATPQINIFANIFIVKIMLGFIFIFLSIPFLNEVFLQINDVLTEQLFEVLELFVTK